MSKEKMYRQCRLSRGTGRMVGYIEDRGAVVGRQVEILDDNKALWTVDSASDSLVPQSYLEFKRSANRHGSIM